MPWRVFRVFVADLRILLALISLQRHSKNTKQINKDTGERLNKRSMADYLNNYQGWIDSGILSTEEIEELKALDEGEIKERFSCYLSFGTAGLRGKMKTGMNAMNVYTVALATQGLSNLVIRENQSEQGVVIAYDSRNNSELFAKTSASVLAANGIKVYIFDSLRPTPELSFALRRLGCAAGINITASHNPKEYNGYKAYGEDGAQLSPEAAAGVAAEMAKTDIFKDVKKIDFDLAVESGKITVIGKDIDEDYLANVTAEAVYPEVIKSVADELKIVYSPLHGAGYKLVPEIFRRTSAPITDAERIDLSSYEPSRFSKKTRFCFARTLGLSHHGSTLTKPRTP